MRRFDDVGFAALLVIVSLLFARMGGTIHSRKLRSFDEPPFR